jgi:hypothetical protein
MLLQTFNEQHIFAEVQKTSSGKTEYQIKATI